jgi:hypothetical protein
VLVGVRLIVGVTVGVIVGVGVLVGVKLIVGVGVGVGYSVSQSCIGSISHNVHPSLTLSLYVSFLSVQHVSFMKY